MEVCRKGSIWQCLSLMTIVGIIWKIAWQRPIRLTVAILGQSTGCISRHKTSVNRENDCARECNELCVREGRSVLREGLTCLLPFSGVHLDTIHHMKCATGVWQQVMVKTLDIKLAQLKLGLWGKLRHSYRFVKPGIREDWLVFRWDYMCPTNLCTAYTKEESAHGAKHALAWGHSWLFELC